MTAQHGLAPFQASIPLRQQLRPEKAVALRCGDLIQPVHGRGKLILTAAGPRTGTAWTGTGTPHEPRGGIKHRADGAIRVVPTPPVLVRMLRRHLDEHGSTPDGRLVVRDGVEPPTFRFQADVRGNLPPPTRVSFVSSGSEREPPSAKLSAVDSVAGLLGLREEQASSGGRLYVAVVLPTVSVACEEEAPVSIAARSLVVPRHRWLRHGGYHPLPPQHPLLHADRAR